MHIPPRGYSNRNNVHQLSRFFPILNHFVSVSLPFLKNLISSSPYFPLPLSDILSSPFFPPPSSLVISCRCDRNQRIHEPPRSEEEALEM